LLHHHAIVFLYNSAITLGLPQLNGRVLAISIIFC